MASPRRPLRAARSVAGPFVLLLLLASSATHARAQCPAVPVPFGGTLAEGAEHGAAVALAGDLAVVGAPGQPDALGQPVGAVTVATWDGEGFSTELLPTSPLLGEGARFGAAVAVAPSGTVIAVGAPGADYVGADCRLVLIYERNPYNGAWTVVGQFAGTAADGRLGSALDADEERVAAGAPGAVLGAGAVTVYRRYAGGYWGPEASLAGSAPGDGFGHAVALAGERLAVGVPFDDQVGIPPVIDTGAVFVYGFVGFGWNFLHALQPTASPADGARFGFALDAWGDDLLVGAPAAPGSGTPAEGCALYRWETDAYALLGDLPGGPPGAEQLGQAVVLGAERGALGAPGADPLGLGAGTGAATLLEHLALGSYDQWTTATVAADVSAAPGDRFGAALAVSGTRLLVGSPGASSDGLPGAGRATLLDLEGTVAFADLGGELPGQGGAVPVLVGLAGPCDAPVHHLHVDDGAPSAPAFMVFGLSPLDQPFKGGVLVPRPDLVLPWPLTAAGDLLLAVPVPAGLPALSLWSQVWVGDPDGPQGFAASNGLRADVPAS